METIRPTEQIARSGMFALEFASAMGHIFNNELPEKVDREKLSHLTSIFESVILNL